MWQHFGRQVVRQQSRRLLFGRHQPCNYFVSLTPVIGFAAKTINVPSMGDSITEGTVVEWLVEPGQAVQADDVVAMVETDKVTVEIKADISGVVTKHFSSVDETVEVGSPLYEIDTDATASSEPSTKSAAPSGKEDSSSASSESETASSPAPAAKEEQPAAADSSSGSSSSSGGSHRTPSIQFLGKEGWAARLRGEDPTTSSSSSSGSGSEPVVDTTPIHPMYGRPAFSEEEMEAFMLGGADQAPKVISQSSGAKFSY